MKEQLKEVAEFPVPAHIIAIHAVAEKTAKEVGYKNKMPVYPTGKFGNPPSDEQIRGYKSRFFNWQTELLHKKRMHLLDLEAAVFSEKALHNINNN